MGKIYCIIGKSATGKDTIFRCLLERQELGLKNIISYTTRPIRHNETEGIEYYFTDEAREQELIAAGKVIERRTYDTFHGRWDYFTVDDGQVDLDKGDYLIIGTLESFKKLSDYYKSDNVIPIYITVEDGMRLERALTRERMQKVPKYEEMCRRFLTDSVDFSEEKLKEAGVEREFINYSIDETVHEIESYILSKRSESR